MYYKVLLDGKSFHGGDFEWSLPENGKPGKWHSVKGDLKMCERGFHLTDNPQKWWDRTAKCYEVEYKDALAPQDDKICVRKVRLVRELTEDDLVRLQIFYSGTHKVTSGKALAYDTSRVKALGSSQVTAHDFSQVTALNSSRVEAYGFSRVTASGSSRVTASGSSRVEAYGSSRVTAYGSSRVTAYGSSQVTAYNSSQVTAYNSSQVTACDSSTINSRFHSGTVELSGDAIHINRDTNPPTIRGNFQ